LSVRTETPRIVNGNPGLYMDLWSRFLLGLFAFTLLLRLADRLELVLHPRQHVDRIRSLYLGGATLSGDSIQPVLSGSEILERVGRCTYSRLARAWQTTAGEKTLIYVESLRSALWGDSLLHLGCLLVIAGVFATIQWGWHEGDIALAAGESFEVSHDPGYVLSLDSVPLSSGSGDAQSPEDTCIRLESPEGETRDHCLSELRPYLAPGLAVFLVSKGPALRLSARGQSGESLSFQPFIQGEEAGPSLALKFREAQDGVHVFLPQPGVMIRAVRYESLPEEGYDSPVYLVRGYRGNQSSPLFSHFVGQDDSLQWQGITLSMTVEDYVVLNVVGDSGWWVLLGGLLLLLVGSVARQWPIPWLARFELRAEEDNVPGFRLASLWSGRGCTARNERILGVLLGCTEAAEE
jgi:hypothetical protein